MSGDNVQSPEPLGGEQWPTPPVELTPAEQFGTVLAIEAFLLLLFGGLLRSASREWMTYFATPLIASQFLVVAMWFAAGRTPLPVRAAALAVTLCIWPVLLGAGPEFGGTVTALSVYCGVAAVPVWLARLLNIRVRATLADAPPPPERLQFSIARIFSVTAGVAILLAVSRAAERRGLRPDLVSILIMLASVAVGLATAAATLAVRGAAQKVAGAAGLATLLALVLCAIPFTDTREQVAILIVANLQVLFVALLLLPYRSIGYRIQR